MRHREEGGAEYSNVTRSPHSGARQGMESHLRTVQENCHLRVKYKNKLRFKIDVM